MPLKKGKNVSPQKLIILVVDDSKSIRYHLNEILQKHFPVEKVVQAGDGVEAWEILQNEKFDLVLSDWNMPNMNGDELLYKVRGNEATKGVPFILLTTRNDKDSVITAIQAGTTDYLVKPFDETEAVQRIRKVLGA